ncbi:MAG: NUDIX hydrolase [Firmicutes bacterium]|nr:NUDIX hydrolase [Bacillota bacterium]
MLEMTTQRVCINGIEKDYKIVRHSGAVAILAIDGDRMAFVWQTRPAIGRKMLEIPAGTLEFNEDPDECAVRELEEETGCRAARWEKLGVLHIAPGYSTEVIHLYLAEDLTMGEQNLDDTEDIEVRWIPLNKLDQMIRSGEITDAKTVAGLMHLRLRNGER